MTRLMVISMVMILTIISGFGDFNRAEAAEAAEAADAAEAAEPRLLYSATNGSAPAQFNWLTTEDGEISAGYLQGPGAVLALNDQLRLFADTLNFRLVLRAADDGKVIKVFEFPAESELEFQPLIIDLADAGNGVVYAADENNLAVWKLNLGQDWNAEEMTVEAVYTVGKLNSEADDDGGGSEVKQLNRIFADWNQVLYVVDIVQQSTIAFNPDGSRKFVYQGLTNGVPDRGGLLYHPIYYGDSQKRDLEVFDGAGRMVGHLGQIDFKCPISYIAPLGFDNDGTLYIFADSEVDGPMLVRILRADQQQLISSIDQAAWGLDSSTPYWIGPGGSIEWAEYSAEEVKIYRQVL